MHGEMRGKRYDFVSATFGTMAREWRENGEMEKAYVRGNAFIVEFTLLYGSRSRGRTRNGAQEKGETHTLKGSLWSYPGFL